MGGFGGSLERVTAPLDNWVCHCGCRRKMDYERWPRLPDGGGYCEGGLLPLSALNSWFPLVWHRPGHELLSSSVWGVWNHQTVADSEGQFTYITLYSLAFEFPKKKKKVKKN